MQKKTQSVEAIWRKYDEDEQRLTAEVSQRMLDLGQLSPGMKVLDIATGRGEPAVPAAHRVAPQGKVVGIDLDETMLKMANERAVREGVSNLELQVGNAETLAEWVSDPFDIALSRWGLMYFQNPVKALTAIRQVVRPGGKLIAALWAEAERVAYYTLPRSIVARHLPVPEIDPESPNTFRFGEEWRLRRDFEAAGWIIDSIEEIDVTVMEAVDSEGLIEWTRCFGMNRLLAGASDEVQKRWEKDLVEACQPCFRQGAYRLGGITRLVVAR